MGITSKDHNELVDNFIGDKMGIKQEQGEKRTLVEQKSEAALNFDAGKERLDLVPPEAIYGIARAFEDGMKKGYPVNNWLKGMSYTRQIGCILRHLFVWMLGRQKDPESGLHPLDHAICRLAMLVTYEAHPDRYVNFDDRYIHEKNI